LFAGRALCGEDKSKKGDGTDLWKREMPREPAKKPRDKNYGYLVPRGEKDDCQFRVTIKKNIR